MAQVVATRSELIARRQQIGLAGQGRDLLTDKRTALVEEYRRLGREVLSGLQQLEALAARASAALADAEVAEPGCVASAGLPATRVLGARIRSRVVAGVGIVEIDADPVRRGRTERGLTLLTSSARVDAIADRYEELVESLLAIAALELSLRRLAREISRTTRQVNGLEHVVIPRLQAERDQIGAVLAARELEERVRLQRARSRTAGRS